MAYPTESEHKDYMNYVIERQEQGMDYMSKEEWRKQRKKEGEKLAQKDNVSRKTILSGD